MRDFSFNPYSSAIIAPANRNKDKRKIQSFKFKVSRFNLFRLKSYRPKRKIKIMALAKAHPIFSVENYLEYERLQPERHEFLDGSVYAMAGESPNHSTICFNLAGILHNQLRGKRCRGFSPNMKIATNEKGLYSYPDLAVVCGEPRFYDRKKDVIVNPTAVFEVLSPSTESYDRGEKFLRYTNQIETLESYILISQDKPSIEHFQKESGGKWKKHEFSGLETVLKIDSIECEISLAELYELIEFA